VNDVDEIRFALERLFIMYYSVLVFFEVEVHFAQPVEDDGIIFVEHEGFLELVDRSVEHRFFEIKFAQFEMDVGVLRLERNRDLEFGYGLFHLVKARVYQPQLDVGGVVFEIEFGDRYELLLCFFVNTLSLIGFA